MPATFNNRMPDGCRHFADLPEAADWEALRNHIRQLESAVISKCVASDREAWIEFTYGGHSFSANNHHVGRWSLFVEDPECPEATLADVLLHCARLLSAADDLV